MKKILAAAALAAIILTSGTANAYESRGNQCGEYPEFIAADFELYRLADAIRAWMYAHEIASGPTEDANPFRKD